MLLGGAGDTYNSISMLNYCDGPYLDLDVCVSKGPSTWTEVWTATWPSRASIMAPRGRSGQILQFSRFWEGLVISITE